MINTLLFKPVSISLIIASTGLLGCQAPQDASLTYVQSLNENKPKSTVLVLVRNINGIQQNASNNCWAAAYTMMLSWKKQQSITMEKAMSELGSQWLNAFHENTGLPAQDYFHRDFIDQSKLQVEPPANYLPSFYVDLMIKHGPLWINTDVDDLNHAKIMIGAIIDQQSRETNFIFLEPRTGQFFTMNGKDFFLEFESEARKIMSQELKWEFRYQILHW